MQKLNIGSGPGTEKQEGIVRVDIVPEWADECFDIRVGRFPFENDYFDEIEIHHTLEHIQLNEDFLHVMEEMQRVLKVGGTIDITVPHHESEMAYDCYEHTRFFNENSFMNFYDNPYHKEMGLPIFKRIVNEKRPFDSGVEVHVILEKI
jgi:predicted SAM-dependent methyltransferase